MNPRIPSLPQVLILVFCLWRSMDLLVFWHTAPNIEYYGWIVFLAWLGPVLHSRLLGEAGAVPALSIAGALCTAVGMLAESNTMEHMGLTLAISSFMPPSSYTVLYMTTAISWMPVFTWFAGYLMPGPSFPQQSFGIRCLIAMFAIVAYRLRINTASTEEPRS